MGLWYLKADDVTKLVGDWGLTISSLVYRSLAPDELVLSQGGANANAADLFDFEDMIELFFQSDEEDVGTRVRIFLGQVVAPNTKERVASAFKVYRAQNAWRKLAEDRFRQSVAIAVGPHLQQFVPRIQEDGTPR